MKTCYEMVSSLSKVYKPLFEAVGDGSGGKSLEDAFYEHEVGPGGAAGSLSGVRGLPLQNCPA